VSDLVTINLAGNGVARVSLNNPSKHNAFDDAIIKELTSAFRQIDSDDSIKVLVLQAEGKSFSAGGDLDWMKRMAGYSYEENLADAKLLAEMLRTLNFLNKPTIARVQGAAFGGAVGLVSCCDIAVGSTRSSFCLSEVKVGLVPATISPYVVAAMGERASRRYFLSAERFSAETASDLNLLSSVVEEDQLDQEVDRFITLLLANGPQALKASKKIIADVAHKAIDEKLIEHTCELIANVRGSEEGQEGLSAFLEKRAPNWKDAE
jgi:methylglutaconyl-CoA hydratase